MVFSKVNYEDLKGPIASVDRSTGQLYIDPARWGKISPKHQKFVLLHEEGHIILDTADEISANRYALDKFMPVGMLSNDEFSSRILVLSDLLETEGREYPEPERNNFLMELAGTVGNLFGSLQKLGVGSKARQKEAQQQAEITLQIEEAKSKSIQKSILIGGILILVITVLIFTLKK